MGNYFHKLPAKIMGGALLAVLTIAGGAIALATPVAPTQQTTSICSACQTIQTEIDLVYDQIEMDEAEIAEYGKQIESLLDASTEAAYGGDTAMMVEDLQSAVLEGTLATGPICNDPVNTFAYYSSFSYEGTLYCVINELMWMGPAPDNFNFFKHMSFLTEAWDPSISEDWLEAWTEMIEPLTDYNNDRSVNIVNLTIILDGLLKDLKNCEDENCPVLIECPDCEEYLPDEANLTLSKSFESEEEGQEPGDIDEHWAEDFIRELFNAGIVSGDDETGDFRPDEAINRAEAAKIVSLAKGDTSETCDATYFPDVLATNWFCIFTTNAFDKEYFTGYEDGTFGPANAILRAEAAAVVLRALGFEVSEYESYNFPDLTGDEWYADYAQRAYECGLFEGRMVNGEKVFAGDAQITRAEMAKIVNLSLVQSMDEQTACGAG